MTTKRLAAIIFGIPCLAVLFVLWLLFIETPQAIRRKFRQFCGYKHP